MNKVILFLNKKDCCGCGACIASCPFGALHMVIDEEGFQYPEINNVLCKECFKCKKVCPLK